MVHQIFQKKYQLILLNHLHLTFSLIKFIPSELVTNLASSLSSYVLLSKPKLKTFKFFLSCIVLEIATIKELSRPPDNKNPSGLSLINLSYILSLSSSSNSAT